MKNIAILVVIIILVIVGFVLFGSNNETNQAQEEQKSEESEEESVTEAEMAPANSSVYKIELASANYLATKKWFNKPTEEVLGKTNAVTGEIFYDSSSNTLTGLSIEVDDQTFSTENTGRDRDVRDMFASEGGIKISLSETLSIPMGDFKLSVPLNLKINENSQVVDFEVQGSVSAEELDAQGSANITFEQFNLKPPSILSVYEVDSHLTLSFSVKANAPIEEE